LTQDRNSALYAAHRKALVDYAASLTGSRVQAEDLVQDAFLRIDPMARAAPAPGFLNPLAYLYRVIRNLAWDQSRRRTVEQRWQQDPVPWMAPADQQTPEQDSIHQQQVQVVAAVIAALPENARIAVEMQRFGGYTLQEVAARLGVSVPTAHRLVHGALLQIAIALDYGGPPR
jgi:RNA polymerase sigma-70 factor (ECF subfamily)